MPVLLDDRPPAKARARSPAGFDGSAEPYDGLEAPQIGPARHRNLCTDCGLSRMAISDACGRACQFIQPDYPAAEMRVHGINRDQQVAADGDKNDALFFGPYKRMLRASLAQPKCGAQWSGITTTIAARLLEAKAIDAVLCVAPDKDDRWKPVPVLITKPDAMARVRGMRMGYAPLLALLERAKAKGFKRVAMIGIACQVHALRSIEAELGFEKIYVIGTPCSDNTTTANFHRFLELLDPEPDTIGYLEFRADFQVELRYDDGRRREIPFLKLPISDLPSDFFPLTCRTCVDYTNALSDITVGYMAGEGDQWLIVRNDRGAEMLSLIEDELLIKPLRSGGKRQGSVKGFLENTRLAAGGLPLRRMPDWARPIIGWLMPKIGPKGLEFARSRVEMKAIECILHLERQMPRAMKRMVPSHVWKIAAPYGLSHGKTNAQGAVNKMRE